MYFVVNITYLAQFRHTQVSEEQLLQCSQSILCLPLLKRSSCRRRCIPESWVCTLLCSSNSDPGAHGKCLVLGEVFLTPVWDRPCSWISIISLVLAGGCGSLWHCGSLQDTKRGFPAELYTLCSSLLRIYLESWVIPKDLGAAVEEL